MEYTVSFLKQASETFCVQCTIIADQKLQYFATHDNNDEYFLKLNFIFFLMITFFFVVAILLLLFFFFCSFLLSMLLLFHCVSDSF